MWERDDDRLALLELLLTGTLRRRAGQAEAWALLADTPWTRLTRRRNELRLVPQQKAAVVELLDRVWPEWRIASDALAARALPPTPTAWRRLQDRLRAEGVARLPARLNRRTAAAAVAPHSKATLGPTRRAALSDTEITRDGLVRLRPPSGLRFVRGDRALDAVAVAGVLGEVAISERALLDGTTLEGDVAAVLLVENLGPFQDLEPSDGWLVAHVPGWETATLRAFIRVLGEDVPVIHFGDLDPAGVRIVQHLRKTLPRLAWAVPEFWAEYVDARALPGEWPGDIDLGTAPALVRDLARRGLWLEQETIALDPRLHAWLEATVEGRAPDLYGDGPIPPVPIGR